MTTNNSINAPTNQFLQLAGGTMAGNIAMGTNAITGLANPVNAQDATTKTYVDNIAIGGGQPVFAATTANLNTTYNNGVAGVGATLTDASGTFAAFSVDGQSPSVGARILVKNQSTNANNGVYTLTTNGNGVSIPYVLTRAVDYDTPANINDTGLIPVENGTVNANTGWYNSTTMVTVGTTAITFVKFGNANSVNKIVQQIFTSTGTYTPTSGMVYCIIEVVGGGGGGGGIAAAASGGGAGEGGAGGGYSKGVFTAANIGVSQTVTIGAAGAAGASTGGSGGTGGTSSVGVLISATGGGGGGAGSNITTGFSFIVAGSSLGGSGSGGSLNLTGNPGGAGITYGATNYTNLGGFGGASAGVSGGGGAVSNGGPGSTGGNYGGGGTGGALTSNLGRAGGAGAPGVVYVTEFCSI